MMIEALKEELKNSLKGVEEKQTKLEGINKSLKKSNPSKSNR